MDLSRGNEKAIGVELRMGQMEDLRMILTTLKEKEMSFHFSKIDCVIKISPSEL